MNFGKILGAFVDIPKEEDQPKLDPSKPIKPQVTGQTKPIHTSFDSSPATTSQPTYTSVGSSSLADLNEFRKHFETILLEDNQKNMPGIDYYEFIQAKNTMPLPVEAQKYTIAFSAQAPGGLTKEILITTAQHYIDVIDAELAEFSVGFDSTFKEQVESKKAVMEQKSQEMLKLSEQITQLNSEITAMKDDVMSAESNLTGKKNAFVQAANEAKGVIQQEVEKINQYIV